MGWCLALGFSEADFFFYLAVKFEPLKAPTILDISHEPQRSGNFKPQRKKYRKEKEMERQIEELTPKGHMPPRNSKRAAPWEIKKNFRYTDRYMPGRIGPHPKKM